MQGYLSTLLKNVKSRGRSERLLARAVGRERLLSPSRNDAPNRKSRIIAGYLGKVRCSGDSRPRLDATGRPMLCGVGESRKSISEVTHHRAQGVLVGRRQPNLVLERGAAGAAAIKLVRRDPSQSAATIRSRVQQPQL